MVIKSSPTIPNPESPIK